MLMDKKGKGLKNPVKIFNIILIVVASIAAIMFVALSTYENECFKKEYSYVDEACSSVTMSFIRENYNLLASIFYVLVGVVLAMSFSRILFWVVRRDEKNVSIAAVIFAIFAAFGIMRIVSLIEENQANIEPLPTTTDRPIEPWDRPMVKKPIMYIYPEKETELSVKLLNAGTLTSSYPKYENEWKVKVLPDGNIYDYKTERNYYALYWEGVDGSALNTAEGFVVKGEDTAKFFEEKLAILGLNEREIEELVIYWLPIMEKNEYNFIHFKTEEEINNYMPLKFSEEPETLIRVMFDFKAVDGDFKTNEQKLEKKVRKGFTVVEWGGREIKD